MKILVVSDSYGTLYTLNLVIEKHLEHIDALIHLGDRCDDITKLKERFSNIKFYEVIGNNDYDVDKPSKISLKIGGKKVICVHGHRYGVKTSYDRIFNAASREKADIFLFGHTLIPAIFYYGKTLFLNPGSISIPSRSKFPSFGIIEISENGVVTPSIFWIKKKTFLEANFNKKLRYF